MYVFNVNLFHLSRHFRPALISHLSPRRVFSLLLSFSSLAWPHYLDWGDEKKKVFEDQPSSLRATSIDVNEGTNKRIFVQVSRHASFTLKRGMN